VGFHTFIIYIELAELPKVGFHGAKGRLRGLEDLRGFEGGLFSFGGLPYLIYIIIRASRTARSLYLALYGAKVGFHASKDPE